MSCKIGTPSEADLKMLEELGKLQRVREEQFFKLMGLSDVQISSGAYAYDIFLKELAKKNDGRTEFYKSPLARKSFIVGRYFDT